MQEIAAVSKGAASLHGHVPSHLLHPLLVRVDSDPGDVHLAALEMDEKQHEVGHRSWGYDRIFGALDHLGHEVSEQKVRNILRRLRVPPPLAPKHSTTRG